MPSKKPYIMVRTTQEVIEKFKQLSEEQNRSMANLAETLILNYIKEQETLQSRTEQKSKLEKSSISRTG